MSKSSERTTRQALARSALFLYINKGYLFRLVIWVVLVSPVLVIEALLYVLAWLADGFALVMGRIFDGWVWMLHKTRVVPALWRWVGEVKELPRG